MKKRYVLFIIVFTVALVAFSSCRSYDAGKGIMIKYFSDIEQFSVMDEYVIKDLSPDDDKYLKDIPYAESYTKQLEFEGKKYQVYAYVFENDEDSQKYYGLCTSYKTNQRRTYNFHTTTYSKSYGIVLYDKCVYRFYGGKHDAFVEAYNYLTESFPMFYRNLNSNVADGDHDLYQIFDDDEFSTLINNNPIDPYIRAKYDQSDNAFDFGNAVLEENRIWMAELENALQKYRACLDYEGLAEFNASQIAWETMIEANFIWQTKELYEKDYIDVATVIPQRKAALYKQRTIEVKYFHYLHDKNADISFVFKG